MWSTINRLRKTPERHRKTVVVASAGLITLVIFTLWLGAFTVLPKADEVIVAENDVTMPDISFGENMATALQGLKDQMSFIKTLFSGKLEYSAEYTADPVR